VGVSHRISNCFNNFMNVFQNIVICKSNYPIALFHFKPSCPLLIIFFLFQMRTPIYFDNHFRLNTNKVKYVGANSMLPAKI